MSLKGYYQNGYVTHDLDRAIALFASDFGLGEFSRFDIDLMLETPAGPRDASVRVGTAWAGKLQVELIQPVAGYIDPYVNALPADRNDAVPRFHHVAVRRESVADMRLEVERLGLPLMFETAGAGINSTFIDTRARLGHHLELVCAQFYAPAVH